MRNICRSSGLDAPCPARDQDIGRKLEADGTEWLKWHGFHLDEFFQEHRFWCNCSGIVCKIRNPYFVPETVQSVRELIESLLQTSVAVLDPGSAVYETNIE